MDALAYVLQPYKELVGSLASIVTIGYMFSGCFICWDIYKKGSTKGIGIMPFIGGLVMSLLNLKYGFMLRDSNMIQVNIAGLALNIVYLVIFFQYSQEKVTVWAQIGASGAFSAALIGYTEIEDPELVENRFGLIITALMFYLLAAPLFDLKQIITKKSTEGLPFPMILSGTIVTFMWLLYGIILRNNFIVAQNVVAFVLCAFQLSLFVVYPSTPSPVHEKKKAEKAD